MPLKKGGRYDVSTLAEAQCEPGSRGRVLRNLLGIKKKQEMDLVEAEALKRAVDALVRTYDQNHRFTAEDIRGIHRVWLGGIYEWAGNYRQVNLSKGHFTFAAAVHIPRLMKAFEEGPLRQHTSCHFASRDRVIQALAEVHTELLLIHPFREGNGRAARILATLMASQAGLPFLDFGLIHERKMLEYFAAVRAGLERNYLPMEKMFRLVIERTFSGS